MLQFVRDFYSILEEFYMENSIPDFDQRPSLQDEYYFSSSCSCSSSSSSSSSDYDYNAPIRSITPKPKPPSPPPPKEFFKKEEFDLK